jgi:hypothetical protein
MAFRKFANATVVKAGIDLSSWNSVRTQGGKPNFGQRDAAKVVLQEYNPKDYLLTHCTIIASVDTEKSEEALGKQMVEGFQIERKYADWLVTPKTTKYINNNHDCFERKLLLSSFGTFIGGSNFVEHIQIPELSKGKLLDAAARDLGDTVYVDILIATDRKHKPLITAIKNGSLQTLSMGCFVPGTPISMAGGARLPIEEVWPGSMVLTHKGRAREVLNQQTRGGHWSMRRMRVEGVPDSIEATSTHPFFVFRSTKVEVEQVCASELQVGDYMIFPSDPDRVKAPITSIESFEYEGYVYNIEVDEDHSYQVNGIATKNCQVEFTICTKCGNVAYDETQICSHIRYFKGNKYVDASGIERKTAELCGHINEEPGSVKFIEASWVANPAFEGAVLRSFITPEEIKQVEKRMQVAFSMPSRVPDPNSLQKAASLQLAQEDFPGDGQAVPEEPKEEVDPISKAVDSLVDMLKERAIEKVRGEIGKDDASKSLDENRNTTLIKDALQHPVWRDMARVVLGTVKDPKVACKLLLGMVLYKRGGWKAVQASKALTGREVLGLARLFDLSSKKASRAGDARMYRVVVAVGPINRHQDEKAYLAACRQVVGRDLTDSEKMTLLARGHLFSLGS